MLAAGIKYTEIKVVINLVKNLSDMITVKTYFSFLTI